MVRTCEHCGVEFEGAAQARFHSDACRKAHARALLEDSSLPTRQVRTDKIVDPPKPVAEPALRMPTVTLESYVKQIRFEALEYSKAIGETNEPWPIPGTSETISNRRTDRLARAEKYARWRYEGFLSGEVASL